MLQWAGVQNISVQIEQPFSVLPLDSFCRVMKANLRHMEGSRTQALQLLSGELAKMPPAEQTLMVQVAAPPAQSSLSVWWSCPLLQAANVEKDVKDCNC